MVVVGGKGGGFIFGNLKMAIFRHVTVHECVVLYVHPGYYVNM